ncbi:GspE/PulE family protein [Ralstonia pseudosolanacearum]|uniref:GspE/PulE family protein n=1 Tax=Ralstonia pseudosolanacearum TaxID=1310165 RepID=UPI000B3B1B35|nr:GspE/PulE family protein [Ralstonia pseudosolanacearum]ARU25512.1 hypothetical protein RSSE_p1329 [Ralstonia solanacearum]MDO3527249.1 GspE/PulE family protein [Ralstonia pseudosolanacearum]MDO3533893.1 GspE/PulE family protein [Ralstonia pseudosolanacearum]
MSEWAPDWTAFGNWLRAARMARGSGSLATALAEQAGMPAQALVSAAAGRFGFHLLDAEGELAPLVTLDPISLKDCRQHKILPLRIAGDWVIAMDDPWDEALVRWVNEKLGHARLAWMDGLHSLAILERALSTASASALLAQRGAEKTVQDQDVGRVVSHDSIESTESAVVRFLDAVLLDAWRAGASDIHVETSRSGLHIKLRLDGVLVPGPAFTGARSPSEVLNRIKVLAQLDIGETRLPQDGRFRVRLEGRDVDMRVSIMPNVFGEDAVIRLLDKAQLRGASETLTLEALGFDTAATATIRRLTKEPHGMLLVTGPTGSGKTTTLYAALSEINTGRDKIITIEDPVEYELSGILQIPVNEKKGLTFARGLRSILRHDPDQILVGEIRDPETAEIAVQAALTGHLVFTSVHANSALDVVGRFLHMGVDPYNFMSALIGIVSQRLLRLKCPECAPASPDPGSRSVGCPACRYTGYRGRTVVWEIVPVNDTIRELVIRREPLRLIREQSRQMGVVSLRDQAVRMVERGLTTFEEIDRVVSPNE